jgi:inner membrane protein
VDALSHALITYILFAAPGLTPLIPFAVVGAVIPDADILFSLMSDSTPSLYLFTHGGITHSITGAFVLSLLIYGTAVLLATAGIIPASGIAATGVIGFAAVLAGALLHLLIDVTAIPGIPVLAPFSDRKYTLGVLPGPSMLLAIAALGLVTVTTLSFLPFSFAIVLYGATVLIYIAGRTGMFLIAGVKLSGRKIPSINPFRWLVIREDENSYMIRYYTLFHGHSDETVFEKSRNTGAQDITVASRFPHVRRFFFFSYIVIAERKGDVLILTDPLREKGYLYYPMKFRQVEITLE